MWGSLFSSFYCFTNQVCLFFMQLENGVDSGVDDSVAGCSASPRSAPSVAGSSTSLSSTPKSQMSTPRTHSDRSGSNREVVKLLLKMNSTLDSLVDITRKLAAEGGVKKEDDPKYTVSIHCSGS